MEQEIIAERSKKGKEIPVQKDEILQKLRRKTYHWKPVMYDAYKSLLHLTARMASDYAVILQCFNEISSRVPDFVPRSIYNLGSGLGSVIWAGNVTWGERVFEYYCVDKSQDMNTMARLLLQDGECQKQMHIPGVTFRQFPPSAFANKFTMVVSAYTLLEHAGKEERLQTIEALWHMTEDFLVLVENGTAAGFSLIYEARNHLLQMADSANSEHLQGYVFAPCPHDQACPRITNKNIPCFFKTDFTHLKENVAQSNKDFVRYSYVILRKGRRPEGEEWPRVVQDVVMPSKHSHCHLCCADGSAQHVIITQTRHGKDLYKCTRYTVWGDRLPVKISAGLSQNEDHTMADKSGKYNS
ncbi:methyltransferase-like protein 17, mitochondrial isoform X2 [Pomacea canaliculata]|nr:methyltransferase-like protein 17, mitochondrial isoform X2 [Pomacea canaliculata]